MTLTAAQAKSRLEALSAEVSQASQTVAEAREAVSFGEATERDVAHAQRDLIKAQDRCEQGKSDLKIAERRAAVEAEATAREAARIRRELDTITRQKAAVEAEKYREFLASVKATAAGFNQRLVQFEGQLGYRSLITPGRFNSYGLLIQAVDDQLQHFTKLTNYGEAV